MLNREGLLHYYGEYEDRALLHNIFRFADQCSHEYIWFFTDFLDPRQMSIALEAIKCCPGKKVDFFGGVTDAERHLCCIHDIATDMDIVEPPIAIVKFMWNRDRRLTHRDFLGTFIGEGVKRNKIGDIIVKEKDAYVVAEETMANYFITYIGRIGGEPVHSERVTSAEDIVKNSKLYHDTVASLRLDVILSSGFHISRGEATDAVRAGKVFVNWQKEQSSSKTLKENDTITLRGKGRIVLEEVLGTTKKDRIKVCIKKYI